MAFNPLDIFGGIFDLITSSINVNNQRLENETDREFNADQAALNRNFTAKQAELAYERQVDFYENYQSPAAMMSQYKEAGLNPALMAGGSVGQNHSVNAPAAQGTAASANSSPLPMLIGLANAVMNIEEIKATIAEKEAFANKAQADANKTDKETSWIDRINERNLEVSSAQISEIEQNIKNKQQEVEESIQRVQESAKRMSLMDSEIAVNGAQVALLGSQKVLNETRNALEKLNVEKMEKLMPYIELREEAEIALSNAKTEEATNHAESLMYEANFKMLKVMVEQKLIDSQYYDDVIGQQHWDVKYKKREYKWKPINDLCYNISMLMIGAGSLSSGGASAANAKNNNTVRRVIKGYQMASKSAKK